MVIGLTIKRCTCEADFLILITTYSIRRSRICYWLTVTKLHFMLVVCIAWFSVSCKKYDGPLSRRNRSARLGVKIIGSKHTNTLYTFTFKILVVTNITWSSTLFERPNLLYEPTTAISKKVIYIHKNAEFKIISGVLFKLVYT